MKTITRACPRCEGVGTIELTGVYADTLRLLKRQRREVNGAELARMAGVTGPAMVNRLMALWQMGLVVRREAGRERLWRVKDY